MFAEIASSEAIFDYPSAAKGEEEIYLFDWWERSLKSKYSNCDY